MPIVVPTPENRVEETNFPTERLTQKATAETFGLRPESTKAIENLTTTTSDIAATEAARADKIAVESATSELSAASTDILWNPKTGIKTRLGKNAFTAPEDAQAAFKEAQSKIYDKLNGGIQKSAFNRQAMSMGTDLHRQTQEHVAGQIRVFENETTSSLIKNEQNAAALSYNDPQRIQSALQRQRGAIIDFGQRNGIPPERLQELTQDEVSKTHSAVVIRMLGDSQDLMAQKYFDDNKGELTAKDKDDVQKLVEEGSIRGGSQRLSDLIVAKHDNRADALEAARKEKNPKLRDATEERVNRFFSEQKQAQQENAQQSYLDAANIVDQAKITDPMKVRDAIPPNMWLAMTPEHREALMRRVEDVPNNNQAWLDFLELARNPDHISEMGRATFEEKYWSKFDPSHRGRAEAIFEGASRGVNTVTVPKAQIDATVVNSSLIPGFKMGQKMSTSVAESYAAFEQSVNDEVVKWQDAHNKKADPSEIQGILDKMVLQKVFVHNTFFPDKTVPAVLAGAGQRKRAYVPMKNIPQPDRNAIENVIRSNGKKITEEKIERAMGAYVTGDRNRFQEIVTE